MEKLKDTHDVNVQWHAFELRPPGSPPMPPEYKERIKQMQPRFNAIAKEQYGLVIERGPSGISSRPALIGAKYAEAQGVGEAYNVAMLSAYWQEARDISEREVMAAVAESVGLDRAAYLAALDDPQWEAAMLADVRQAHEFMISGVPALIFSDKYIVTGAQPYELLAQAVEKIEARERA